MYVVKLNTKYRPLNCPKKKGAHIKMSITLMNLFTLLCVVASLFKYYKNNIFKPDLTTNIRFKKENSRVNSF